MTSLKKKKKKHVKEAASRCCTRKFLLTTSKAKHIRQTHLFKAELQVVS